MFLTLTVTTNAWADSTPGTGYTLVTDISSLSTNDKVILFCNQNGEGVSGYNGNKDATVSTTAANWIEYLVTKSTNSFTLKDGDKYIANPEGNEFKYGESGGACTLGSDGLLICNSRNLMKNGNNYRFYATTQSYTNRFYVYKVAVSYAITAQSNNTTYGTVSLSGTTITATPKTGYRVSTTTPYTISPSNSAKVTQNGNTFTVTPSANTTITIYFEAIPKYTVTLMDDESTLTQSTAGGSVTLPSRDGCDGYEFVGWTKSWSVAQTTWTTTAPNIIPDGSYTPTANESLYPVYTKTEGGGSEPVAYSAGDEGDFVIASYNTSNSKWYAIPENPTLSSDKITGVEITVSQTAGGVKYVSTANAEGYTWTIADATNGQTISDGTKYIYHKNGGASGTDLAYGTSTSYTWKIEQETNGLTFKGMNGSTTNSRGLLFNGSAFGGYALSNEGVSGYYRIQVLPIGGGSTTYYISTPDCDSSCDDAVTISKGTETNGIFTLSTIGNQSTCDGHVIVTVSNIQPAVGYQFSEITQSGVDNAKVTINNTDKTVSYAQNATGTSTINVTFTPKEYTLPLESSLSCVTNGSVTFAYNATSAKTFTAATRDDYTCTGYWSAPSGGVQVLKTDGTFVGENVNGFITDGKWINTTATKLTPRWETEYKMILSKGTEENGTYTLSTTNIETSECATSTIRQVTITATPDAGYEVDRITYNGDGTASIISGPTLNTGKTTWVYAFEKNDKGEGTFIVTFKSLPQYTITWLANGQEHHVQTDVEGTAIEIPAEPEAATYVCDDKVFVGWIGQEISGSTDEEPTFITEFDNIESDVNYYAVFATPGEGGDDIPLISFLGGVKSELLAIGGISASGLGDDYAESNAPYRIKLDNTGDYILYTNSSGSKITKLYIKVKMIGGGNTSKITVQTSDNNSDYTNIYDWSIQGDQNDVKYVFLTVDSSSKYIRLYFTKGSNVGLGNMIFYTSSISYSDYVTTCDNTKATITYDLNGGTGATCDKTIVTKDVEFTLCNQTPTKVGYTFAGWSDGTKTYAAGSQAIVSESTTFYAAWTAKTITITWDQNYTDCPESETSTYIYDGEEIEMPEDPIRKGYKFTGWFTESSDGTQITEVGETNKPSADVTYYAQWEKLHTVTFIASGQVYVKQEHKYISGDKLVLPEIDPSAANFACDGYLFEGWSKYQQTKEDANRPELVDDNTLVENDLELHAVWKKASTSGAGTQIFYESFDTEEGSGANDGDWGNDVGTETLVNDTWNFANGYGAYHCVKLGSSKNRGSATTPALTQLSGDAKLSFKAAAWVNNNETTTLNLSISGGGTLTPTSVTMVKGAWTTYEVQIKDGTPSSTITFAAANAANNRFFLDEVMITTSGSYNYTTSPNCGPTMVAKENVWATSATGQSVKVNVPLGIKQFEGAATIIGTSTNENFVVNTLENAGNGEHNLVVAYTPTADDTKENTTITLTAKNGEEIWCTTTFTLNGRSLPTEFVVVANRGDKNYALPANMTEANTYPGLEVEVNGNEVTAAPMSHLYIARAVHSTRFDENGTAIRLVGNNDACLWASNAASGTHIRNFAQQSNAKSENYEWNLYTEDGDTYYISSTAVTEEGRVLRLDGTNFGMYKQGVDAFRLLPVGCTSTPMNVQTSATRTSATISWTNAGECNVVVKQGSTTVQSISAAASPLVVGNLAESTTYTFTLTPTDDASCGTEGSFTTTGPTIDIVEWETNGILIQVDKDNELNPKVVIKGEEEHGNVGGNVADELFFSKYFEAHAENKLLAIFNGTTATIDLTGYTIKSENGTLDLSQFGQTKGKVASNEEIILVYFDANYSAEKCAEEQQGYENWNILTEKSVLAFSGRGSLGLYKNDVLIDVIGSTFPSGELTKIGKSVNGSECNDADVQLYVDEGDGPVSVNDQSSFFCYNGDNIKTDNVETDYALSTNRCLLIRKNTVTSGANAVATNKATAGATCGDLSSTFTTLGSEWSGFRIGSGKSSTDEIKNATCDGLGYVGGFDYNNYYRTLETLDNSKTLNEYTRNADENTYFIEIEDLAQYSCLNIQLQLTDDGGNVLTEQTSQVPILVAGEKSTTDEIFSAIVKDSETSEPDYETSKIRCSTCDVVILENATLTKADAETVNDVNQVRDIYIYPGGKLVVPANATDYSVNNVSLRRVQDEVAAADIQAPLNITSSSKAPIFVNVRIDANNWHWFALPYDCNIADVTWADGSKAAHNTDWFLMYYDGESRAASTNPHDNHWKVYEGTKIEAGKGYIVGITGDVYKPAVKFELRFPMAQKVLTAEQTDKTVALNAWGVKSDNTPNNKGWNLVGNPYLNYYQPETTGFAGLSLLKYTGIDPVTGDRLYDDSGNIPFLVTPIDGGWYEYQQELASDVQMMPFTAYFVQVGDPSNPDHTDGKELNASFEASNRGKKSILHRAQSEVDELDEPAIVAVSLTNAKGESDKTTLLIAERFTNEYEMNADFFKWFGDYYKYYTKPVLYTIGADQGKRAFNALNEDLATQPISLGMYAAQAGNYTFSLNLRNELAQVQEVWLYDATQDVYTNLLQDDYTFHTAKTESAGRFFLSVKMAPKVTTDTENLTSGSIWATTHNKTITINGLLSISNVWVYDATGKLLHADQTQYFQHSFSVPQTGAYFVRVQNTMQTQTIKVVVE